MSNIQSEFGIRAAVLRTFLYRPLHIHNQVAGGALFTGHRFAAETDDIGRSVLAEKFTVILRDAGIIRQQQSDFLPDGIRIGRFQYGRQFSGQPPDCRQIDPAFLPVYQSGFHL